MLKGQHVAVSSLAPEILAGTQTLPCRSAFAKGKKRKPFAPLAANNGQRRADQLE
jgi:hypothetical protein